MMTPIKMTKDEVDGFCERLKAQLLDSLALGFTILVSRKEYDYERCGKPAAKMMGHRIVIGIGSGAYGMTTSIPGFPPCDCGLETHNMDCALVKEMNRQRQTKETCDACGCVILPSSQEWKTKGHCLCGDCFWKGITWAAKQALNQP